MLILLQLHRTVPKGGGLLWDLELNDEHGLVHPDPCPLPGVGIPGLLLVEKASHFPVPRCVLGF